jgi:hypothetical protein
MSDALKRAIQRYGGKMIANRLAAPLLKRGTKIPILLDPATTLLVVHVGRRSGETFETPVSYRHVDEGRIRTVAENGHLSDWARNATSAEQVTIWVEGKERKARAEFRDDLDANFEMERLLGATSIGLRLLATEPGVVDFLLSAIDLPDSPEENR